MFEQRFAEAPDLSDLTSAARRVLVEAAVLFSEQGAAGTSVRDIVKACGLSPGAFYKHFASKDEVLHRLVRHGHDTVDERLSAALARTGPTPVEVVAAFVHAYVLGHLVHPELAQVVRREYVHLSPGPRAEIVARRRALRARLERVIVTGAREGDFVLIDGPHAARRTAVMVLDMCSRTSEWYDPTRAEPPEGLADRYVAAALRLVGSRGAPDMPRGEPVAAVRDRLPPDGAS